MTTQTTSMCTGEVCYHTVLADGWHGKFGHLNIETLDHDSACTGYGAHDRVCAGVMSEGGNLLCRVDLLWGLGEPTREQVLKVARHDGWKGRWKLVSCEPYTTRRNGSDRDHIEWVFSKNRTHLKQRQKKVK